MIHVALGFNNPFSKFAGTTLVSVFENHSPPRSITVHLLHDNTLTLDNYEKFVYLAGQYNQIIKFYNVEKLLPEDVEKVRSKAASIYLQKWSITGPFRLMVGKLLPDVDKLIYLDADLIVNLDIGELWQIELGNSVFAAVPEADISKYNVAERKICIDGFVKPQNYLNVGVMIMNLNRLRKNDSVIWEGVDAVLSHGYNPFDQEALNYSFSEETIKLPRKFNVWVRIQKRFSDDTRIERKIYHYLGKGDSLGLDMRDKFNRLYWYYFAKTPWFNENTINNLYNGVRKIYAEQKNLMTQVSAMVSGKRRAFVTFPQNVETLKQVFYVQEGEEIFKINSPDELIELVNDIAKSVGKKIYFMLIAQIYSPLRAVLIEAGLVEGRDFINAEMFLSELQGVQFNSYPLIANM